MIRVELPAHLRTLAGVRGAVTLELPTAGQTEVTLGQALDALEATYPVLRGAIRDYGTGRRRAFVRFFACQEDLSHESQDLPLPDSVLAGREPLMVVGAIAGG